MSALLDSLPAPCDTLPQGDSAGLASRRREAIDAQRRDGLPGPRVEAWKYTSLRALERRAFDVPPASAEDPAWVAGIPSPRIAFVNGRFSAALSDLAGLPDGLRVEALSGLLARGAAAEAFIEAADRADRPFSRLNTALAVEGAVIRVAAGHAIETPLHVVSISAPSGSDVASHLRHVIELETGARAFVVEHVVAGADHSNLSTSVAHVRLAGGARLAHARLQDDATGATLFARTDAVLAEDAIYDRLDLELGAGLSRHELDIAIAGDRACANANGVLLADARRHLDTRLGIDHAARDGRCELTWRGLASGRSRAAFHGGILIREGADGTEAALSNKNLLLSDAAEIDSQPVLVIHADEVQAAHGATVGQLDPTSLFYLRSRGIPAAEARALLTTAFCRETLSVLDDGDVRDLLAARLDAALARMAAA